MKEDDPFAGTDGLGFYETLCATGEMEQKYRFPEDLEDWMASLKGKGTLESPYRCEVLETIENESSDTLDWCALANVFFIDAHGMLYQYVNKTSWKMDAPGRIIVNMISCNGKRCGRVVRYDDLRLWDIRYLPLEYREFVERTADEEIHRMLTYEEYAKLQRRPPKTRIRPADLEQFDIRPKTSLLPAPQNLPQKKRFTIPSNPKDFIGDLIGGGFLLGVFVLFPIGWTVYCLVNFGLFSLATWFWPGMIAVGWLAAKLHYR